MNISFPIPIEFGYTIYVKSGCPYCERVKYLLQNVRPQPLYVDCDAFLTFNRNRFLSFIKQINGGIDHKTFPMVFLNGYFIGGYNETKLFCEEALNYKN